MTLTQQEIDERLAHMERVRAWVEAAIEDGWTIKPTYKNESMDRAATLVSQEGFKAMALTREPQEETKDDFGNRYPSASLNVWGPDEIGVKHTFPYDWEKLNDNLQLCQYCGETFEGKAYRVAFADRACMTCGPKEQSKLPHNWCD